MEQAIKGKYLPDSADCGINVKAAGTREWVSPLYVATLKKNRENGALQLVIRLE